MTPLIETRSKATVAILFLGLTAAALATAADLRVPADHPTIQAAVNAAHANDTIHIAPGVYTEQVLIISNKLTLIGQPGTILRATEKMTSSPVNPSGSVPIISVWLSQVTVRGLTFEGEHLAERFADPGVGDQEGIFFRQSSGAVENCAFYGFRESTPGPEGAQVIVFINFEDQPNEVDFRLTGSTFADNYAGVTVVGSGNRKSINLTIENNTIVGPGPLENIDYQGINIGEGVSGRVAGNTISGYSYIGTTADFPIGFGLVAYNNSNPSGFEPLQPLIIEGNTFRDNQFHIALVKADNSVVTNNLFQGTAPGIVPVGLSVTGKDLIIASNQFEDMAEGIRLVGDDPTFGSILGTAVDAQVTNNRFRNVTKPINVEPLANATEVGTLLWPFPPPTLAIALLLSWPGEEVGWALESATGLDGPWAASDAAPFTQNGRHSIAVPADGQHQFFRLR